MRNGCASHSMTVLSAVATSWPRPRTQGHRYLPSQPFTDKTLTQKNADRRSVASTRRQSLHSSHDVVCEAGRTDDITRRGLMTGVAYVMLNVGIGSSFAALAEETLEEYEDSVTGFALSYPKGWISSEIQSPDETYIGQRTLVWYPKDVPARDVNVTMIISNAGADYTKLGSFGTPEDFGSNVVNSMDRSFLKRRMVGRKATADDDDDVQTARLVDAKSIKGMYSIEYLLKKPKEEEKRLLSLVALRSDGIYNRLYTLTAQCADADFPKYQSEIQTILNSFKPPEGTS